jgi:UDP-N-acetylglucosamine 2-epimerase (non-hydrolysing)
MKILTVAGARPNFMKVAPLMEEMARHPSIERILVHTGQHYDATMSGAFFDDLQMSEPTHYLGVGSGSHAEQTARVMLEFEKVLVAESPDLVVVVGDVNSTLACALVAAKLRVPVAHVEAGLRSFDRTMPEEINRKLTDHLSDHLFTTSADANENLRSEGIKGAKVHLVGNVMIDSLRKYEPVARRQQTARSIALEPGEYALLTLHRPSNVDTPEAFGAILDATDRICRHVPVLFPMHPRSRLRLTEFGLDKRVRSSPNLKLAEPYGYVKFLSLMIDSCLVLTDSGGVQEETTALGIPCLTLRENTERPVTVTVGTNTVVGLDPERIVAAATGILDGRTKAWDIPPLWDGRAAGRIVSHVISNFGASN